MPLVRRKVRTLPKGAVVALSMSAQNAHYLSMLVRRQLLMLDAKLDTALDVTNDVLDIQRRITKDGLILLLDTLSEIDADG